MKSENKSKAVAQSQPKKVKLALQGGGAHGAFAWGVIDAILEDGRLEIEAIVGTSAGAMNAAVTAYGLIDGGSQRARNLLHAFWEKNSLAGKQSPLQPSPLDKLLSRGNMDYSPLYAWLDNVSRVVSPYECNPQNMNPLKDLISDVVDFEAIRNGANICKLFIAATNVLTGRLRVFEQDEISADVVMASACLPFLFQAVEVDNNYYWDGGYSGNPPIFPLIYDQGTHDVLIVQINPINIPDVPRTAREILDRVNTLSFNSSLMRELRAIKFVSDLIDNGELDQNKHSKIHIHTIDAEHELAQFNVSSKLNPDWEWLKYLYGVGRRKAHDFLDRHYDQIGLASSVNIAEKFM